MPYIYGYLKQKGNIMSNPILEQYKILVSFLGAALGPDYEIVLHDITSEPGQIIAIANSHISDREIGSPTTNAALQMLAANSYKTNDYLFNYPVAADETHILRASTMFIKDQEGNPIGLLGINFDDRRYRNLCEKLLSSIHPEEFSQAKNSLSLEAPVPAETSPQQPDSLKEDFPMDISALMEKAFESATASLDTPIDRLNQQEKRDIVQKLQERGVFKLKGGIAFAAKNLSCSPATVYRYLGDMEN